MFNINSPTVQQMLKDLPEGMGNMQFYNGNPPTITHEEYPINNDGKVEQPYPSPKEMIADSQQVYNNNPYQAPSFIQERYQPQYPQYQPQYPQMQYPQYYQPQYPQPQYPQYQYSQMQYNPYAFQGQYYQPQNQYFPTNSYYTAQRQAELMQYMKPWAILNPFGSPMAESCITNMQAYYNEHYADNEPEMSYIDVWKAQEDAYYGKKNYGIPYLINQYAPPTYVKPYSKTTVYDPCNSRGLGFTSFLEDPNERKPHFRNVKALVINICKIYPEADIYFRQNTIDGVPFENQLEDMINYCKMLLEISFKSVGKTDEELLEYESQLFDPDPEPVEKSGIFDLDSDIDDIPVYDTEYDSEKKVVTLTLVTDKKKKQKRITERRYRAPLYNEAHDQRVQFMREKALQRQNELYEISPERKFDNVPFADMLTNNYMGQVGVYYTMAESEIDNRKNISKIYDHSTFMNRLERDTSNKSEFEEKMIGRFYGRYGVMPDGRPTDPSSHPKVAESFSIDPQSGEIYIEAPKDFSGFDENPSKADSLEGVTVNPPNVVGRYKDKLKEQFYNSLFTSTSPVRGD